MQQCLHFSGLAALVLAKANYGKFEGKILFATLVIV